MNRNNGRAIGERIVFLRDLFNYNSDKTHAISMKEIIEFYENKGFGTLNNKTIYRDLDTLRDIFNMQIEYDLSSKGYIILNPAFEPYELRLMIDSIQASKFITQKKANEITKKIKDNFVSSKIAHLDRGAFVDERIKSMNDSVVKDADRIYEAISENRKIAFQYFHITPTIQKTKKYSKDGKQYIVSPFALYWNNGNLYLYAFDGSKFRYFRVDRMERISYPLQEVREGNREFNVKSLTDRPAKVFQMYQGEEMTVTMRFRNELADAVIDQFGNEIMMRPDGDEHFIIVAPVSVSPPFYSWIFTFGRRVKIIDPPQAVEGMREYTEKVLNMYKDDGNI